MSTALTSGDSAVRSAVVTMLPPSASNSMIAQLLAGEGPAASPGDAIASRIAARAGGGRPLPAEIRAEVESGMGQQFGDVRIHDDIEATDLATRLGARAFTSGQDIFFNSGVYNPATPDGYEVLAHELTHTLQQSAGPVTGQVVSPGLSVSDPTDRDEQAAYSTARRLAAARGSASTAESPSIMPGPAPHITRVAAQEIPRTVQRDDDSFLDDLIPDLVLDGVRYLVSAIPGYTMLTQIIGTDPLTGDPVPVGREGLIENLLTFGPFGSSVGHLLNTIDVLDDVFSTVSSELTAHNLTLDRIGDEIESAWSDLSITEGIDGNAAMLKRRVDGILDDALAAVSALVDRVIEIVRSVIAEVAERALQTPEIKPVWDLARKVLHYDPLRGEDVSAPTVEILADFLRLIHQDERLAQMQERGTLQQAADWLDTQFATFSSIGTDLIALFRAAWEAIQPANLPDLLDTLPALAQRAFALVQRIADFATTLIAKVLELVKHSLLGWLSEHAHELPGFHLLTVILGRNPFTGDAVPRTAENLIRGFITLMPGGEATYEQLAEAGVISEAATRIETAMVRLGISWDLVIATFRGIWDGMSLDDLLNPIGAFDRILTQFGEPLGRLVEFATEVIQVVIILILRLMNFPSDLVGSIIDNAMAAIDDIKRDPVAFLVNMLLALKNGFVGFLDEIVTFLIQGLGAWLFRGLAQIGITIPADFSMQSVLPLVLQVLGVSMETLWQKLGKHIGEDKVAMLRAGIDKVQGAWAFIKDVQENGVSAIWTYIVDQLGNLWDSIIGMARDWIMTEIVQAVTTRLISMLDPTGVMAVIRSVQALFNAIQSGIEYLRDILEIVNEYVTTFAQVAAGNVGPGAEKIKMGLAHAVPIAIGFLANQVGIGNIPEKIVEIIGGLRELIDRALDWLFEQAMRLGAAALNTLGIGGPTTASSPDAVVIDEPVNTEGESHHLRTERGSPELFLHSTPIPLTQINDPTGNIVQLNTDYLTRRTAYETALTQLATGATTQAQADAAKAQLDAKVLEIVQHVSSIGLSSNPGASAPNIGMVEKYGEQAGRIRGPANSRIRAPQIWQTEAEHLIPFGTASTLWTALCATTPIRGQFEDHEQTTIVIYWRAARIKTPDDNALTRLAQQAAPRIAREVNRKVDVINILGEFGEMARDTSLLVSLVDRVEQELEPIRVAAAKRTSDAIDQENGETEDTFTQTNSARRGDEAPTPGAAEIGAAADAQLRDIITMLRSAFEVALERMGAD
ncbi:DUF4157 domain-containing protein [Lentzea sp. NPDC005914]|uniref:eCIS core domain-containing protein n=1 Tax=Lentzea sp. NPDC005914 TaxID=3154572 RepID=UPI0033FF2780